MMVELDEVLEIISKIYPLNDSGYSNGIEIKERIIDAVKNETAEICTCSGICTCDKDGC